MLTKTEKKSYETGNAFSSKIQKVSHVYGPRQPTTKI